jgi:hypothetical protein
MPKKVKRIGRPMKAPVSGKRVSLGLKVTADIKRRLDAAARASGRTQSQEAEHRIELSYRYERALGDHEQAKKMLTEMEQDNAENVLSRLGWRTVLAFGLGGNVWLPPGRLIGEQSGWADPNKPSPPLTPPKIIPDPELVKILKALEDVIDHAVDRAVKAALNKEGGQ